jgi:hypothetical protein
MEKTPAGYVVYWTSQTTLKNPGYDTPKFKANMKCVKTFDAALKLLNTLDEAQKLGECYGGRLVYHVSGIHQLG